MKPNGHFKNHTCKDVTGMYESKGIERGYMYFADFGNRNSFHQVIFDDTFNSGTAKSEKCYHRRSLNIYFDHTPKEENVTII